MEKRQREFRASAPMEMRNQEKQTVVLGIRGYGSVAEAVSSPDRRTWSH